MSGYFRCLQRIQAVFSKDPQLEGVAQNNLLFFLKIASCISEPDDYCKFVKGLLDWEIVVTPELPVTRCICSKEQLSGENLSKREMQIEIDLDKEFNEKKAPIVAKLRPRNLRNPDEIMIIKPSKENCICTWRALSKIICI